MTIPLYCIAIAFLLIYAPRAVVLYGQTKAEGGLDNAHPREQQALLAGWARRANAAHANAFEAFAPFAAAVLVARAVQASEAWSAGLAVGFVAARTIYPILYVANLSTLRSTVWLIGFLCTAGLFVLSVLN